MTSNELSQANNEKIVEEKAHLVNHPIAENIKESVVQDQQLSEKRRKQIIPLSQTKQILFQNRVFPKPKSPLSFEQICPKLFKDLGGENFCCCEDITFWSI